MVAIPGMGTPPKKEDAAPDAPQPTPAEAATSKLAEVPHRPGDVFPTVRKQVDAAGMPEDEPLRAIFLSLASKLDRLEKLQDSFGPNAGTLAATEAGRVVAMWMPRLIWRIGAWRWAAVGAAMSTCLGIGVFLGTQSNVPTPLGPVPPEVARTLPLQDLRGQFASCRDQPSDGSVEWCLMPWVKGVRPVGR